MLFAVFPTFFRSYPNLFFNFCIKAIDYDMKTDNINFLRDFDQSILYFKASIVLNIKKCSQKGVFLPFSKANK